MAWREDATTYSGSSALTYAANADPSHPPFPDYPWGFTSWAVWAWSAGTKIWYVRQTSPAGSPGSLGDPPPGYSWVWKQLAEGYAGQTIELTAAPSSGVPTAGPVVEVAMGGTAVLGPGEYAVVIEASYDRWQGREETTVTPPAGTTFYLTNEAPGKLTLYGPVAGILSKEIVATAKVTYQQVTGRTPPLKVDPAIFGQGINASFASAGKLDVEVSGRWGIDTSKPGEWRTTWPRLNETGSAAAAAGQTLEGAFIALKQAVAGIMSWVATWGPVIFWIVVGILIFALAPTLLMALAHGVARWQEVYAAFAALL